MRETMLSLNTFQDFLHIIVKFVLKILITVKSCIYIKANTNLNLISIISTYCPQ